MKFPVGAPPPAMPFSGPLKASSQGHKQGFVCQKNPLCGPFSTYNDSQAGANFRTSWKGSGHTNMLLCASGEAWILGWRDPESWPTRSASPGSDSLLSPRKPFWVSLKPTGFQCVLCSGGSRKDEDYSLGPVGKQKFRDAMGLEKGPQTVKRQQVF